MSEEEYDDGIVVVDLGKDLVAWIDEEDKELTKSDWKLKSAGSKKFPHYYAYRRWSSGGFSGEYYLHNEVWERMMDAALPKGFLVDHINGDKLDNRRSNLRLATKSDNEANKKKRRTQGGKAPSSKYKGVSKDQDGRKKCWRAIASREGKSYRLGSFYSEEEAARAYNVKALELFGEFALLNEIEEPGEEKK